MNFFADLAYLLSAFLFVAGLKQLSSPATARKGNIMASLAMLIAIVVTLVQTDILTWTWIITGIIIGSLVGAVAADTRNSLHALAVLAASYPVFRLIGRLRTVA